MIFRKIKNFYGNRLFFWGAVILTFLFIEFSICISWPPLILVVYFASGVITLCGGSCIIGEQINALKTFIGTNKFVLVLLRFGQFLAVITGLSFLVFTGYVYLTATKSAFSPLYENWNTPLFSVEKVPFYFTTFVTGIPLVACPIIVWKTVVVLKDAIVALHQHMGTNPTITDKFCVKIQKTAWKNLLVVGVCIGMFVYYVVSVTYLANLKLIASGLAPNNYIDTFPFIALRCIFYLYLICLLARGTWCYMQRETELVEPNSTTNFKSKLAAVLSWTVVVLLIIALYTTRRFQVDIIPYSNSEPLGRGIVAFFAFLYLGLALLYYHLVFLVAVYSVRLQIATMIPQKAAMTCAVILAVLVLGLRVL